MIWLLVFAVLVIVIRYGHVEIWPSHAGSEPWDRPAPPDYGAENRGHLIVAQAIEQYKNRPRPVMHVWKFNPVNLMARCARCGKESEHLEIELHRADGSSWNYCEART